MSDPGRPVRTPRSLRRYILDDERIAVATRLHWAKLLEPIATTFAVTVVVGWLHSATGFGWFWLLWLVAAGRLAYLWLQWYVEWFVATDKRLVLAYGVIIHKVAMMPLMKVTDMKYSRTPLGQVLGFGRFTMESAGQNQALRQVDHVPKPDRTYRTLCDTMFVKPPAVEKPTSPPAVVPEGREPAPTTAEIPVVGTGGGRGTTGRDDATDRRAPDDSVDAPPAGKLRLPRPTWAPARRPSPYEPPKSAGAGSHVPKPFL